MSKKGFVLSTDAFIALTLLAFLSTVAFFYLSNVSLTAWSNIDLIDYARDEATVLEKQFVFENAIKQQSTDLILSKLNATPDAICFEVSIFSESNPNVPLIYGSKTGCIKTFSQLSIAERTIVVNSDTNVSFYIVRVGAWYK